MMMVMLEMPNVYLVVSGFHFYNETAIKVHSNHSSIQNVREVKV